MKINQLTYFNLLFAFILLIPGFTYAQTLLKPNPDLHRQTWNAKWITHPQITGQETGVYLFKKIIALSSVPPSFIINISADNRYKLYINGAYVSNGPARGDLLKWRYETLEISKYLKEGKNTIAVKVWNLSSMRPVAQFSHETGLIIQGNTDLAQKLNTNQSWQVMADSAYIFYPHMGSYLQTYFVTGPGEEFDTNKHFWEWQEPKFEHPAWLPARELQSGIEFGSLRKYGAVPPRVLYPRDIPLMQEQIQSFASIRKCEGINIDKAKSILSEEGNLIIPSNSQVSILLDQEVLTNAYPRILFSQGKNSKIRITYAESLFHTIKKNGQELISKHKGNRDIIEGKKIKGNYDIVVCDGGNNRLFEPLWWRTFRYVQIDIDTGEEALILHSFTSAFTGYPLVQKAKFETDLSDLSKIFEVAWRTQRLCAGENFFDCPYYEQLQYSGDTRIQGLITYYISGDTLLWKKSLFDFYDSRLPNGLTQSRYPCYETQLIPTYSLVWITMLHDYMMHCQEVNFIREMLPAVQDILQWFANRIDQQSQLLGEVEGWNFVDWVNYEAWDSGVPPLYQGANSAIFSLQFIYTLQKAQELFRYFGQNDLAKEWQSQIDIMQKAVVHKCWDDKRKLIADHPAKTHFSQHANILAVLSHTLSEDLQKDVIARIYMDTTLAQCSYYFRFYLAEALKQVGLGEQYVSTLSPWRAMLNQGLTTFIEGPEPSRSDCHAWSASPLYHFYTIVCGIESASPSFAKVSIKPHLGDLKWLNASFPHPQGELKLALKQSSKKSIKGEITLPQGLTGNLYWKGKQIYLKSGENKIDL